MRYNPDTKKYEPRTAQSLDANADFSVWTLKLKAGIKFTDGTDYNADAVKFVIEREMKEGNSNPRGQLTQFIDTITVNDPLTLTFKLKLAWAGFPQLLAGPGGMIFSPTQFAKVGDANKFNVDPGPAGAGPFKLKSYKPGESIEYERNPTFYGGEVYLDGLKFILVGGAAAVYEALKANTIQAGYTLDSAVINKARDEKYGTSLSLSVAGNSINMNSGIEIACKSGAPAVCAGKPDGELVKTKTATSDLRVRKAVAAAVDPKVVNERAYQGAAKPNSAPFANSPWDPKVDGPKYDPTEARRLVAEAKAAGWDGKIRLLSANTPEGQAWAEAVRAQLATVGMDVQADTTKSTAEIVAQVLVQRDFDLATWGYSILSDADSAYPALSGSFGSKEKRYGYGTAEFDAAVDLLRTADTDAKRTEAFKKISELWVRDLPAHVITSLEQGLIFTPKLHGVQRTAYTNFIFDKAWLER
jgi:peptide/nickel transport system substrate-binding protein